MELATKHGLDGVMIGRAAIGNPFCFSDRLGGDASEVPVVLRLTALVDLLVEYHLHLQPHKPFSPIQRMFKRFITGVDGAKHLRIQLAASKTPRDAITTLQEYASAVRTSCSPATAEDQDTAGYWWQRLTTAAAFSQYHNTELLRFDCDATFEAFMLYCESAKQAVARPPINHDDFLLKQYRAFDHVLP